jgi:predicted RNA binding protein YcfA (HicA-like mRNA interferase family)/predicted RNase H-like HicB family nuclease
MRSGAQTIAQTVQMKVRDAIKMIESDGWRLTRTRGSHRQYRHPTKPGTVTIADHPSLDFGSQDAAFYTEAGRAEVSTYTVFFEPTATGYSAHVPDLPGCVAAAPTLEETRELMREAIEFHIEGMRINGDAIPAPTPHIEQIEVSA